MIRRRFRFLLLLLPVAFFLPSLGGFYFSAGSDYSDMAISHYPIAWNIQQAIREQGRILLWSDAIMSGMPLSANPLSGLHYPPGWLALLFPLPLGLNLVAVLHILFGGWGMYRYLRLLGLSDSGSLFGALAFESMPKWIAHFGAGHLTLVYATAWMPWFMLSVHPLRRNQSGNRLPPGIVLGLICLADLRLAAVAGFLWLLYLVSEFDFRQFGRSFIETARHFFTTMATGAAISAVLLIPLFELLPRSTRGLLSVEDRMTMSLPWTRLIGLFLPDMGGTAEWVLYAGGVVIGFAILGFANLSLRNRLAFWWLAFMVCLVLSVGANLPGYGLLTDLPGFNMLRVPPRLMFAGSFCLIVAASLSLDYFAQNAAMLRKPNRISPVLALIALAVFFFALFPAVWSITGEFSLRIAWGAMSLGSAIVTIFLCRYRLVGSRLLIPLSTGLLLVDLVGSNWLGLQALKSADVLSQGGELASSLITTKISDDFRIYSPSYSVPQQTAAYHRLKLADGVDPIQLLSYRNFMVAATGVPSPGYSVSIPPFATGEPAIDNRAYSPNAELLGLLSVRYVASEFPLQVEGLELLKRYGTTYLYRNHYERPRVWLQPSAIDVDRQTPPSLTMVQANRITAEASGPGVVVAATVHYPGWQVTVDDVKAKLVLIDDLFIGVEIGPGNHVIQFEFVPRPFYLGAGISLASLILIIVGRRLLRKGTDGHA